MIDREAHALMKLIDAKYGLNLTTDEFAHQRWLDFFRSQDDVGSVTLAVQQVIGRQRERVTISDIRSAISKLAPIPVAAAAPDAEFVRQLPAWVKVWLVSRAQGDYRVLPEQQAGYDQLQRQHPHTRTYVWSEQEAMPDDERRRYEALVDKLGNRVSDLFKAALAGGAA